MNQAFSSLQLAIVHGGLSLVPVLSVLTTYFHIHKAEILKKQYFYAVLFSVFR